MLGTLQLQPLWVCILGANGKKTRFCAFLPRFGVLIVFCFKKFFLAIPIGVEWYLIMILICVSLMANDEHFFMLTYSIYISFPVNTVGFCILILCPATLLNSFISSRNFSGRSQRIFYIGDCVVGDRDILFFAFQSIFPFFSLFYCSG